MVDSTVGYDIGRSVAATTLPTAVAVPPARVVAPRRLPTRARVPLTWLIELVF